MLLLSIRNSSQLWTRSSFAAQTSESRVSKVRSGVSENTRQARNLSCLGQCDCNDKQEPTSDLSFQSTAKLQIILPCNILF